MPRNNMFHSLVTGAKDYGMGQIKSEKYDNEKIKLTSHFWKDPRYMLHNIYLNYKPRYDFYLSLTFNFEFLMQKRKQ